MGISSKELAELLKVSPSTVSMVFHDRPGISEETRQRVLNAAKAYGYEYTKKKEKETAGGIINLVIYRKHGAVVGDTPFFSQVMEGIDSSCRAHQCTLQIRYFYENEDHRLQLNAIKAGKAMGTILMATEMNEEDFAKFSVLRMPIVVIDCYYDRIPYDTVLINNIQGAFLATDYLISRGCKTVGYLHSSVKIGNFSERADGYYKALRRHGMETANPWLFSVRPTADAAYYDMKKHLALGRSLPDGFFADNDTIAASCLRALSEVGVSVPEQVSIIGFDNLPIGELLTPPLTTMNVPKHQLGATAVERLLTKCRRKNEVVSKIELSPQLSLRKSVR